MFFDIFARNIYLQMSVLTRLMPGMDSNHMKVPHIS